MTDAQEEDDLWPPAQNPGWHVRPQELDKAHLGHEGKPQMPQMLKQESETGERRDLGMQ
jgi:hypothetical protein